jgi:RHS repeat-associated protein
MPTTAASAEKSHPGFEGREPHLHRGWRRRKPRNAAGMRACVRRKGVGSRCSGKERDGNGLDYFGARYYDGSAYNATFRWISADSLAAHTYDPPSLNKYAYVRNDPVNLVDPDGHTLYHFQFVGRCAGVFLASPLDVEAGSSFFGFFTASCALNDSMSVSGGADETYLRRKQLTAFLDSGMSEDCRELFSVEEISSMKAKVGNVEFWDLRLPEVQKKELKTLVPGWEGTFQDALNSGGNNVAVQLSTSIRDPVTGDVTTVALPHILLGSGFYQLGANQTSLGQRQEDVLFGEFLHYFFNKDGAELVRQFDLIDSPFYVTPRDKENQFHKFIEAGCPKGMRNPQ